MKEPLDNFFVVELAQKDRPLDRYLASQVCTLDFQGKRLALVAMVEILNRWHPAREIGATIAQSFVRFFNKSSHHSVLTRFEDAIKSVNQLITTAQEKINEPINCSLTLLNASDVYFSTIGNAPIFLLRGGKLTQINQDESNQTFTSVTSGQLHSDDWLISTNPELAEVAEATADLPAAQNKAVEGWLRHLAGTNKEKILAGTAIQSTVESNGYQVTIYHDEVESQLPFGRKRFNTVKAEELEDEVLPEISQKRKLQIPALPWKAIFSRLAGIVRGIPVVIRTAIGYLKGLRRNQLIAIGVALVVLIIGLSLLTKNRSHPAVAQEPNPLAISSAPTDFRAFLQENLSAERFQALDQTSQTYFRTLAETENVSLVKLEAPLLSLDQPISQLALDPSGQLYLIDVTGQLWAMKEGQVVKQSQTSLIGSPTSLTALSATKIVATDTAGNIWLFDGSANQPTALALPNSLQTGVKMVSSYNQNLYVYSAETSQIYRVANFAADLKVATSYLSEPYPNLADWTITGDIFTINSTGLLSAFRRGKATGLQVQTAETDGHFVLADLAVNRLLLGNRKLIDVYQEDGQKISTLALPLNEAISDIHTTESTLYVAAGVSLYQLSNSL